MWEEGADRFGCTRSTPRKALGKGGAEKKGKKDAVENMLLKKRRRFRIRLASAGSSLEARNPFKTQAKSTLNNQV